MTGPLDHLGPIGQFLAGLATFLTMAGGFTLWAWSTLKKLKHEVIEATSAYIYRIIRAALEREAARHNPSSYYTLEIAFEGGHVMAVPMFPGVRMLIAENVEMAVNDHNKDGTELGLWCDGIGSLVRHRHMESCETVHVERGAVTCLETGAIYRAGDTWHIPQGEWHSVTFHDCYCRIIHRPPLQTAAARPMNLDAIPAVFPEKP